MQRKPNLDDILFWIFFIVAVITVLWYLIGKSPTIEQALLVLVISFLFKIQGSMSANSAEVRNLKNSFMKLASDFKNHIKHK